MKIMMVITSDKSLIKTTAFSVFLRHRKICLVVDNPCLKWKGEYRSIAKNRWIGSADTKEEIVNQARRSIEIIATSAVTKDPSTVLNIATLGGL